MSAALLMERRRRRSYGNSFRLRRSQDAPAQPGPLSGVRVLDLSAYIAGPYGCTLLADQGADVIKIEPPDGDNLRKYPSTLQAESRAFLGVNRSKLRHHARPQAARRPCGAC